MDKKRLTECDICDTSTHLGMERAGWDGLSQLFKGFTVFKMNTPFAMIKAKGDC